MNCVLELYLNMNDIHNSDKRDNNVQNTIIVFDSFLFSKRLGYNRI